MLLYCIPCLRAKAPTEKQGAVHMLFFHAHRENLVKLQKGLSLTGSFAHTPAQKTNTLHNYLGTVPKLIDVVTKHKLPAGLGRTSIKRDATSIRRDATRRKVCIY